TRRQDADVDTLRTWQQQYLEEKYLKPLQHSQNLDAEGGAGLLLAREGRYGEAEEKLGEVLAARPEDPVALNGIGNVDLLSGRADEALQKYIAAQALAADDAGLILNEDLARWARGDRSGADSAFARAVEKLGDPAKALDLLGLPRDEGAGRGARPTKLSPEEIRQRLRLAAARVPPSRPSAGAGTAKRPVSPVVSKVSGTRAADARAPSGVVYWMDYGKEASP